MSMSTRPRILVVGASGFVGGYLLRQLSMRAACFGTRHVASRDDLLPLDVTDAGQVADIFRQVNPDAVLMPAANADADFCERFPEHANRVNVEGPATVARECAHRATRFCFFSTDYVFDGASGPYDELHPVCPTIEYGIQKARAEEIILEAAPNSLIVRTSLVYGHRCDGRGFLAQLTRQTRAGQIFAASATQFNSPTLVTDLVEGVWRLLERGKCGIYNLAGAECISRFDFAMRIAAVFQLDSNCITAVDDGRLRRPLKCGLLIGKARGQIEYLPMSIIDGLRSLIEQKAVQKFLNTKEK